MDREIVVEMAPFLVAKGVTDETLIEASKILENDFLSLQKGFIKKELVKGHDSFWIDVVYWASESDARAATKNASESNECYSYFQLMDPDHLCDFGSYAVSYKMTELVE